MRKINDLTVRQFEALVESAVERKLVEMLGDPDAGLVLKPTVKARLRRSLAAVRRGERCISAEDVARDLKLKW